MLTIALIEDDDNLISLIEENLKLELHCEIKVCRHEEKISELLEKKENYDLIVCRDLTDGNNTPFKLSTKLIKNTRNDPILVVGNEDPELDVTYYFLAIQNFDVRTLLKKIEEIVDPEEKHRKEDVPDYIPFALHYFFNITRFESDIYIKLKKRGSDQYVKRINANEEIDKQTLLKYKESGLHELYIPKEYRFRFIDSVVFETLKSIQKVHSQKESSSPEEVVSIGNDTYNLTADLVKDMGVTDQTVRLTEASISNIQKSMKGLKKIAPLLQRLLNDPLSYSYKRCHLIAMFSLEVLKRIEWFSKDQINENFSRLSFASFLHDILLNDEELLRIHSKVDLYKADLDDKQKDLVMNHANITASLIQKYPHAPSNVDAIIKHHHGTTNGVGFSDVTNSSLPKLAIIFIVVESFVIRLLDYDKETETLKDIFDDLYEDFSQPSYRKVMDCLHKTLISEAKAS